MRSLYIVTAIADGIIKVSPASVLKMTENGGGIPRHCSPARPDFDCRRRIILCSVCRSIVYARRKSVF